MAIKVDLLPTERKKFGFDPVIAILVVLIALAVVVFYYFGVKLEKDINDRKEGIKKVEAEIQSLQQQLPIIEKLKKENQELETQINTVKSLRYDPIRYSNLLDEISQLMPKNIWVSNINIEPAQTKLTMSATAAQLPGIRPLESIGGFMKSIQKSKYFRSATLSSTSKGSVQVAGNTYVSFGFSLDITYDSAAAEQQNPGGAERGPGAFNHNTLLGQREGVEIR